MGLKRAEQKSHVQVPFAFDIAHIVMHIVMDAQGGTNEVASIYGRNGFDIILKNRNVWMLATSFVPPCQRKPMHPRTKQSISHLKRTCTRDYLSVVCNPKLEKRAENFSVRFLFISGAAFAKPKPVKL